MSGGVSVGSNMVADISEFLIWWLISVSGVVSVGSNMVTDISEWSSYCGF